MKKSPCNWPCCPCLAHRSASGQGVVTSDHRWSPAGKQPEAIKFRAQHLTLNTFKVSSSLNTQHLTLVKFRAHSTLGRQVPRELPPPPHLSSCGGQRLSKSSHTFVLITNGVEFIYTLAQQVVVDNLEQTDNKKSFER